MLEIRSKYIEVLVWSQWGLGADLRAICMAARFVSPGSGIGSNQIPGLTNWQRVFVVDEPYEVGISGSNGRHCRSCRDAFQQECSGWAQNALNITM